MNKAFSFTVVCLLLGLLAACKKEVEVLPVDHTSRYYPNLVGRYLDYQIDSLYFNLFSGTVDTFSYQIREEVTEFVKDAEGRNTQRILRYKKVNSVWEPMRVYTAFVGSKRVERSEENTTFIKMVFPLRQDSSWNGNAMNALGAQNYFCKSVHKPFSIFTHTYDSCATIMQQLDSTLITKNEEKEIYAVNIGLIYKRSTHVEDRSSVIDPSLPISARANTGTDVRMYLIGYGVK